ncbi:short-chain dehydrogenase [Paenibacillus sp. 32O-W]|jgi:Dehydrogenases with different specificities (related to short-chain alcohol dehydrogenases)|uniref:SDR family NAD(P)-dependent oxidoreductase n=1 Tax=Paenibacillus sp. 32O-W TaxID=1695218 RepID=UPI000722003E|nr:glucose 1-dehydrogenase [Paenibacillus sp. 32O-W]ALS25540.1 short-chain dehydrogenase [Paenibacillus sp. 32O-W]
MDFKKRFDLTGKVSLVTGAATGLGKSMAEALASFGSSVVIADMNVEQAQRTAEEIAREHNVQTHAIAVNVADESQVRSMYDTIIDKFGKLNVLVNNAGICQKIKAIDQSLADWQRTMDVNVNGVFLCAKYAALHMMKNGGGSIVNIASMSGFIANTEAQCAYNASKAAVVMITKCLASEWVEYNIRVNAIAPGYMKTAMTKPIFEEGGELAHVLNYVPMKRLGNPEELGGVVVLLASDASSFTTGATYLVDGGYTIH